MKTTDFEAVKNILHRLNLLVNGVETKASVRDVNTNKLNHIIHVKTDGNFSGLKNFKSPYPDINVTFVEQDNQIIIKGADFEYKFPPEMIRHIMTKFDKITIPKQQPVKQPVKQLVKQHVKQTELITKTAVKNMEQQSKNQSNCQSLTIQKKQSLWLVILSK